MQPQPFGYYTLINRVNVGGMAEVFKACYYQDDDKPVFAAIKKILPNLAQDQSFVDMFVTEAKMASKLLHPGIAQIIEQGCEKGEYYIAMEYVSGKDLLFLRHHLKDKGANFSPALSAFVIACVAEALDYAHFKQDESGQYLGIIHRDVSPQNILISYEGDVKLIDFGIAKAKDRTYENTRVGVLKGKFGYMAPEQLLGKNNVNHRADIFSLGIVFYELLTNRRLFYGDNDLETLELVRSAKIEPPSLKHPWISKTLDQIIMKALAKNPDDRYQRAGEFAADLRRFLEFEAPNTNQSQLRNWMYQEFSNLIANERAQESYLLDQLKGTSEDDLDSTVLNSNKYDLLFQPNQTPPHFAPYQTPMQQQGYAPQYQQQMGVNHLQSKSQAIVNMPLNSDGQPLLRSIVTPAPLGMPQREQYMVSPVNTPPQYQAQLSQEATFEASISFDIELPVLNEPYQDLQQQQGFSALPTANLKPVQVAYPQGMATNSSLHEQNTPITPMNTGHSQKWVYLIAVLLIVSLVGFFMNFKGVEYELILNTSQLIPNTTLKINDQVFQIHQSTYQIVLPAKSYKIEISAPDYMTFQRELSLNQNEKLNYELQALDEIQISLQVMTSPPQADVIYQGKVLGKTPLQIPKFLISKKKASIELKLKNHLTEKVNVMIKANKTDYKITKNLTSIK